MEHNSCTDVSVIHKAATVSRPGLAEDSSSDDDEPSNRQDHHTIYSPLPSSYNPGVPVCHPCNTHTHIHTHTHITISTANVTIYFAGHFHSGTHKAILLLLLLHSFNGLFFRTTWVSQHQKKAELFW